MLATGFGRFRGDVFAVVDAAVIAVVRGGSGALLVERERASEGGRERADAGERFFEGSPPGPAGREVKRPAPGGPCEPAGQGEQSAPDGAGGADGLAGQAEHRG
jgi:hypothetical protein